MKIRISQITLILIFASIRLATAQSPGNYQLEKDWLLAPESFKASITEDDNQIVINNGLIERRIDKRLGTTIAYKNLATNESITRSITPEGAVTLDGQTYPLGGIKRQPNDAFILDTWIDKLEPMADSFEITHVEIGLPSERLKWKRVRHHAPDVVWPPTGKSVRIDYKPRKGQLVRVQEKLDSNEGREALFQDNFETLLDSWKVHATSSHPRANLQNEGKAGEIFTYARSAVYGERPLPAETALVEALIAPGSDSGDVWGAGIGLVFKNGKVIKWHLRPGPGDPSISVFTGEKDLATIGGRIDLNKTWRLRIRIEGDNLLFDAQPVGGVWKHYYSMAIPAGYGRPVAFRVGKMDRLGGGTDGPDLNKEIRLKIDEVNFYGTFDEKRLTASVGSLRDLLTVSVHYEIYDGIPCLSKWITVKNDSRQPITVDRFNLETLRLVERGNADVFQQTAETLDRSRQLHVETDMAFSGYTPRNATRHNVKFLSDKDFVTQVDYHRTQPCLLVVEPEFGPAQTVDPGKTFETFRAFELAYDTEERERRGLALRKMYRTIAPWVTENPLILSCISSNPKVVKEAIDQAAEVGFEMVILTFQSGFNAENSDVNYLKEWTEMNDYARSKNIDLGFYSLYASRDEGKNNNMVPPKSHPILFGNCPAITSPWGQAYLKKLYNLFDTTGFTVFENDGPYRGDVDVTARPPWQKGEQDSRWVHWRIWTDFFKHLRANGAYVMTPDYYYLTGSNKCVMGYRERNWKLPRAEQLLHTRQNIFDGTWMKTPSMGYMFVPLTEFHGGGPDSWMEPLKDHLAHYKATLLSNLGLGVQATYRGTRLYDADTTKAMLTDVVAWFKKHRDILESDVIHGRRADGRDLDWMLHVNPKLDEKALLAVYNPTDQAITKTIVVPLYYAGLEGDATMIESDGAKQTIHLDSLHRVRVKVTVEANGFSDYVFQSAAPHEGTEQ